VLGARVEQRAARAGHRRGPRDRVRRAPLGIPYRGPVGPVAQCDTRPIGVASENTAVRALVTVAREHHERIRRHDDAPVDDRSAVVLGRDLPPAEIDGSGAEVEDLDPLSALVGRGARVRHDLVDHDARYRRGNASARRRDAGGAIARHGCRDRQRHERRRRCAHHP
jgi:hypothetical protein